MVLYWYRKKNLKNELTILFVSSCFSFMCVEPEEDIIKFRAVGPVRTKGSLVITFNLFGTSFMIINSHFEGLFEKKPFNVLITFFLCYSWTWLRRSCESSRKFL